LKLGIQFLALDKHLKASYGSIKYIKSIKNRNYFHCTRSAVPGRFFFSGSIASPTMRQQKTAMLLSQ